MVGRPGLELGERLRLVVVAETLGRVEVGLRPPAGSAETPRATGRGESFKAKPERASNALTS